MQPAHICINDVSAVINQIKVNETIHLKEYPLAIKSCKVSATLKSSDRMPIENFLSTNAIASFEWIAMISLQCLFEKSPGNPSIFWNIATLELWIQTKGSMEVQ
jgi:hypothetical protein